MGKKDKEKMAAERERFVSGCGTTNGIDTETAGAIFDLLEKFAGYGFNKSHSAAYGLLSYRTAYLKANYPVEFMAALLGNEINNTDKISVLVGECQRMGMEILPPGVNQSELKFEPEVHAEKRGIRFGLAAVKNLGENAMEAVIAERTARGPFQSFEDFCDRVDLRAANRKAIETMVKCGAFDTFESDRAALFTRIEPTLAAAGLAQKERAAGQCMLFGGDAMSDDAGAAEQAMDYKPWPLLERLGYEKELLGFYVTGHPLDPYRELLEKGNFTAIGALDEMDDSATVTIAGSVANVEQKFSKKDNKPFGIVIVEDLTGSIEFALWSERWAKFGKLIVPGKLIAVEARLDKRDEQIRIQAREVKPVEAKTNTRMVTFDVDLSEKGDALVLDLYKVLQDFPGTQPVRLRLLAERGVVTLRADPVLRITMSEALKKRLPQGASLKQNGAPSA